MLLAGTAHAAGSASASPPLTSGDRHARETPLWIDPYDGFADAIGQDRIAVYVCLVPKSTTDPSYVSVGRKRLRITPQAAARLGNTKVAPYFRAISHKLYRPKFIAAGIIRLTPSEGSIECRLRAATRATGSYTNVLAVDNTLRGGGEAGMGLAQDGWFSTSPSITFRGAWVGGREIGRLPNPWVIAHEIGHTLQWAHSFSGDADEYDNPLDLMSNGAAACTSAAGETYPCAPNDTLAYNRYVAGWITDDEVRAHRSGTSTVQLAETRVDGSKIIVAPSRVTDQYFLTLEARPGGGVDEGLERAGVAIHVVELWPAACGGPRLCGTDRRQGQAIGRPYTFDHVVSPGGVLRVDGLKVTVGQLKNGRYPVTLEGSFKGTDYPGEASSAEAASRRTTQESR